MQWAGEACRGLKLPWCGSRKLRGFDGGAGVSGGTGATASCCQSRFRYECTLRSGSVTHSDTSEIEGESEKKQTHRSQGAFACGRGGGLPSFTARMRTVSLQHGGAGRGGFALDRCSSRSANAPSAITAHYGVQGRRHMHHFLYTVYITSSASVEGPSVRNLSEFNNLKNGPFISQVFFYNIAFSDRTKKSLSKLREVCMEMEIKALREI